MDYYKKRNSVTLFRFSNFSFPDWAYSVSTETPSGTV